MQTSTVGGTAVMGHNCRTTLPDTLEVFLLGRGDPFISFCLVCLGQLIAVGHW